jgi:hypothetical protein
MSVAMPASSMSPMPSPIAAPAADRRRLPFHLSPYTSHERDTRSVPSVRITAKTAALRHDDAIDR